MLEQIKLLLNKPTTEDEELDKLLKTLITLCEDEATHYCNLSDYDDALDYIVVEMVIERYNRMGSEGATAQTTSGMSTTYDSFYSQKVVRLLNKHRRVRML